MDLATGLRDVAAASQELLTWFVGECIPDRKVCLTALRSPSVQPGLIGGQRSVMDRSLLWTVG